MTPVYLSHSDISNFKKCRQMWDYSSVNRQSLVHKKSPALYLMEGSGFHEAVEAIAYGRDPLKAAKDFLVAERERTVQAYKDETGFEPWVTEMASFDESVQLTLELVQQYVDRYGVEDSLSEQGLTYLGAEIPFKIPLAIVDSYGLDREIYYVGTFDGIAVDENGNLWVVENKSYASKPDVEDLQYHSQCNGYAVAFEMLTGMRLTGTLYNGIAKQLIKGPKILSNGLPSTDKRQLVTVQSYLDGLKAVGADPFDPRYTEIFAHLGFREAQGDSRFFHREKIFFNEAQVTSWNSDLELVAYEMISDPTIYRTVPFNGCGPRGQACWFRDICHTQYDGGDVQSVLDARYTTGTYGTMLAMQDSPDMVSSVSELKDFLKGLKDGG